MRFTGILSTACISEIRSSFHWNDCAGFVIPNGTAVQIRATPLSRGILLTRRLYTRKYPDPQEDDRTNRDPVGWDMHQGCPINQPANNNCKPNRVNTE